ncbi:uncharacterized protein LOC110348218 isoform X2 [Heterocephalus glaber]|uniref:Uncharacterized protein LOC110348218 isoform X2 n=1 Tax=Heterocephalus glaber TaxID=10181 RepID=A0AAX6SK74_HETGA|nr:uncharacterized protein LOC110348218 isoform X2 [Heterocephalus glaber]
MGDPASGGIRFQEEFAGLSQQDSEHARRSPCSFLSPPHSWCPGPHGQAQLRVRLCILAQPAMLLRAWVPCGQEGRILLEVGARTTPPRSTDTSCPFVQRGSASTDIRGAARGCRLSLSSPTCTDFPGGLVSTGYLPSPGVPDPSGDACEGPKQPCTAGTQDGWSGVGIFVICGAGPGRAVASQVRKLSPAQNQCYLRPAEGSLHTRALCLFVCQRSSQICYALQGPPAQVSLSLFSRFCTLASERLRVVRGQGWNPGPPALQRWLLP